MDIIQVFPIFRSYLVILAAAALLLLVFSLPIIVFSSPAYSQGRSYEPTMGDIHDPNDPTHWYPQSCCSLNDCEPLDIDDFVETKDGYEINYYSKRFKQRNKGFLSHNDPKIQPSQDGGYHACWVLDHPDRGEADGRFGGNRSSHIPFGNTPAMGYGPVSPIRCFFKPNNV